MTKCFKCHKEISNTIQDNRGKGWNLRNERVCNMCYEASDR